MASAWNRNFTESVLLLDSLSLQNVTQYWLALLAAFSEGTK